MMQCESGSPLPCKQCRTAHFQADASSSSSSYSQFHVPSFEFSPSLPFLDLPGALNLLQSPGYACTIPSSCVVDNTLLNLHAQTYQATNESDNKDSEDALKGDAAEAIDSVDPGTNNLWNKEDFGTEEEVDPHEDVVSNWDILAEEFIVEAEELSKSKHFLLCTL